MAYQESEQNSDISTQNTGAGRSDGTTATIAPPPERVVAPPPPPGPQVTPPEPPGPHGAKKKEDPEKEHKKRFRWFIIGLLILFAILLVVGIIPRLRSKPKLRKEANQESTLPAVQVAYPQIAPPMTTLELPGNIEALQQTEINARAQGFVKQYLVDIGDNVRAGQVLAILDTPDVQQDVEQARSQVAQAKAVLEEQRAQQAQAVANLSEARQNAGKAQAQVVQAKADLNLAYITWQRWTDLAKQGAVSQQAADEKLAAYNNNKANVSSLQAAAGAAVTDITAYQANVRAAVANVGSAQAQLEAGEANLRRSQLTQDFSKVKAPFAGVIINRAIDQGVLVGGSPTSSGGGFNVAANTPLAGGPNAGSNGARQNGGGAQNLMYNSSADSATGGASSAGQPTGSAAATSTGGVPSAASASGSGVASGGVSGNSTTSVFSSNGSTPVLPGSSSTNSSTAAQNAAPKGGAPNTPAVPPQAGSSATSVAPARAAYGNGSTSSQGGTVVSPGTSLYTLARIDIMRIQVNVPQAYAPNIRAGQKAQIRLREYPTGKFVGVVTRTARSIDQQSRTMLVEIQIHNQKKLLLPGMYAQIVFQIPRSGQALLIPTSSLINDSRGTQVATVGGDNKVHMSPVQVGRDYGQTIEVLSGIDARALIVTSPSDTTTEGAPAKAVFATPDASNGSAGGSGGGSTGGMSGQNSGGDSDHPVNGVGVRSNGSTDSTSGINIGINGPTRGGEMKNANAPAAAGGNLGPDTQGRQGKSGNGSAGGGGNDGAAKAPSPNLGQNYGSSKG